LEIIHEHKPSGALWDFKEDINQNNKSAFGEERNKKLMGGGGREEKDEPTNILMTLGKSSAKSSKQHKMANR
jgi:hypothetical protein